MKKSLFITIISFIVAVFCAAVLLSPAVAGAEEPITIDITVESVQPVIVDGKLQLRVLFDYQGDKLSWYEELEEDEEFIVTKTYKVTISQSNEVLDAE